MKKEYGRGTALAAAPRRGHFKLTISERSKRGLLSFYQKRTRIANVFWENFVEFIKKQRHLRKKAIIAERL
jgi:Fe-S cluster assembly ATPase SufC